MGSRKKDYGDYLNKNIDRSYIFQFHARIIVGAVVGVGAGIGAIALPTGIITGVTVASMFAGNLFEYIIPDNRVFEPA
ncbi:hypothetical protein [Wolbachia endosymbiont (group A) of Agelastica alni]|uniref:hypothetical protein n=1 Tax=Wolbachia endosymbiont (group A) of Agelastica alni TaxID=3066130 RepID=UPI003132B918